MTGPRPDPRIRADTGWMRDAACRELPPQWFTGSHDPDDIHRALDTCSRCPVTDACLRAALAHPADADIGIWGGTTERTRRRIPRPPLTTDQATSTPAPQVDRRDAATTRRLPAPEITLRREPNGDFTDATGRVIAFRIHGDPPYMLMIDGRPIARTHTLTEARRHAWRALHAPDTSLSVDGPEPASHRRPSPPARS